MAWSRATAAGAASTPAGRRSACRWACCSTACCRCGAVAAGRGLPVLGLAGAVPAQRPAGGRRALDPDDHRGEPVVREVEESRAARLSADPRGAAPPPQRCRWAIGARVGVGRGLLHLRAVRHDLHRHLPGSCRRGTRSTPRSSPPLPDLFDSLVRPSVRPVRPPPGRCSSASSAPRSGFPFFALLDTGQFGLIVIASVVALICHASLYGPQAAFIAEMFPTRVR